MRLFERAVPRVALVLAIVGGSAPGPAGAGDGDIVDVLQRSQQMRLAALPTADARGARSRIVQTSFDAVRRALPLAPAVELRVIRGPVLAETLQGTVVVANESLADLPETARRFILAHELGHVMLGHWSQMGLLFERWVPGEVTPARTDRVAGPLARDASALAHRQEFEADAYAARMLAAMGASQRDLLAVFMQFGVYGDTATHPGVRKRVAALRELDLPPGPQDVAGATSDLLTREPSTP